MVCVCSFWCRSFILCYEKIYLNTSSRSTMPFCYSSKRFITACTETQNHMRLTAWKETQLEYYYTDSPLSFDATMGQVLWYPCSYYMVLCSSFRKISVPVGYHQLANRGCSRYQSPPGETCVQFLITSKSENQQYTTENSFCLSKTHGKISSNTQ